MLSFLLSFSVNDLRYVVQIRQIDMHTFEEGEPQSILSS